MENEGGGFSPDEGHDSSSQKKDEPRPGIVKTLLVSWVVSFYPAIFIILAPITGGLGLGDEFLILAGLSYCYLLVAAAWLLWDGKYGQAVVVILALFGYYFLVSWFVNYVGV